MNLVYHLTLKTPNVVTEIGSKKIQYHQAGKKGQVTIVACVNATGQAVPPMVIFDAKNLNHAWAKNEVPGTRYGLSNKGWINTDLFEDGWQSTSLDVLLLDVLFFCSLTVTAHTNNQM